MVVEECMLISCSLAEALYQTHQSYTQESCQVLEGHRLVVEGCKNDADYVSDNRFLHVNDVSVALIKDCHSVTNVLYFHLQF